MKREISSLYESTRRGEPSRLAELAVQYVDYAAWQRKWLSGEELERRLGYWKKQMEGAASELQLPQRKKREAVPSYEGMSEKVEIGGEQAEELKQLSRREGATLFMTMLSGFAALLHQYSGQEDLVVGTVIANREREEVEKLIGFLVNTLPLRVDLTGNPSFRELVGRVRENCLAAYEHQEVPYEKMVQEVGRERGTERQALFGVLFQLERQGKEKLDWGGLEWEWFGERSRERRRDAKFELALMLNEQPDGITGNLEYDPDLFDSDTIRQMLAHFQVLLESVLANPEQRIGEINLTGQQESRQLAAAFSQAVPL
jgi:non-ribosomal peptide synthetase component F